MKRYKSYTWIVWLTFTIIIVSAIWLIIRNNGMIKTSADYEELTSFFQIWVVVGLPALLLYLLPKQKASNNPFSQSPIKKLRLQATILFIMGLLFLIAMMLTPEESVFDYFYLYKLLFLFIIPFIIIKIVPAPPMNQSYAKPVQWLYPMLVAVLWIYMYFFSPLSLTSNADYEIGLLYLFIGAAVSFILNSVLEELFYRVWLQTRLEVLLGTWPAVCATAMLWALWHTAIQGGGSLDLAITNAIVYQGVIGLFLGFLWAKYRNVWVLILIHGLMNFPIQIITQIFGG
ncbi:CAAX prenyl protease-like protein [Sinobaca qinghaiensis]|uniref:CAAX prenyl protease-like protein n=1 Tax=Sinobaca qinghaiensis TaxID=342944 RepID=A0A419UWQ5_9BACL|nr:CPBP family intramembrane glutamic endopeptidase [Sinobaca qinghaiensis]RKD69565.1 CAAX prenyl protease-like protein [Sinobaca qinghaiensis]